jgi:hypothetical protein
MRLLNTTTNELKEFPEGDVPDYAILSHTWGDNEVTATDLADGLYSGKEAYWRKINAACKQALADQLEWLWADTCCFPRDNSAERGAAINLVFGWYRDARVCYVYLSDVPSRPGAGHGVEEETEDPEAPGSAFRRSRWFSRGWTLMELLAPPEVRYYSSSWGFLGSYETLGLVSRETAGIPAATESREQMLQSASVATVMSWASGRHTTLPEDKAYCLLGLLGVSMPIIYGEGEEQAFIRLQRRLLQRQDDHSILAWGYGSTDRNDEEDATTLCGGFLAKSLAGLAGCGNLHPCQAWKVKGPAFVGFTGEGVRMRLPLVILTTGIWTAPQSTLYAILNCCVDRDPSKLIAIPLRIDTHRKSDCVYERSGAPIVVSREALSYATLRVIHLRTNRQPSPQLEDIQTHASFSFKVASDLPQTIIGLRPTWEPRIYRPTRYQVLSMDTLPRTRYIDKNGLRWLRSVIRLGRGHVDFDRKRWIRPVPSSLVLVLDYAAPILWRIPSRYESYGVTPEEVTLGPVVRCYVAEDKPEFWDAMWSDPDVASRFQGRRCVAIDDKVVKVSVSQPEKSNLEHFIIDISSRKARDTTTSSPDPNIQRNQLVVVVLRTLGPVFALASCLKLAEYWEVIQANFVPSSGVEDAFVRGEGMLFLASILFGIAGVAYDTHRRSLDPYEPARRYIEALTKEWDFHEEAEEFRPLT